MHNDKLRDKVELSLAPASSVTVQCERIALVGVERLCLYFM